MYILQYLCNDYTMHQSNSKVDIHVVEIYLFLKFIRYLFNIEGLPLNTHDTLIPQYTLYSIYADIYSIHN